jgi:hypothetical protein
MRVFHIVDVDILEHNNEENACLCFNGQSCNIYHIVDSYTKGTHCFDLVTTCFVLCVCVCVCFVMCGCFSNMCTCILGFVLFYCGLFCISRLCIFFIIYFSVTV